MAALNRPEIILILILSHQKLLLILNSLSLPIPHLQVKKGKGEIWTYHNAPSPDLLSSVHRFPNEFHLFVWLCLLSVEIRPMNIHLGTGGEPQASQMSNPLWVFSHGVSHFMLQCGKPSHTIIHEDEGIDGSLWAYVSMWARPNNSGQPQLKLFSHKLQWFTSNIIHLWLQWWVNENRKDYLQDLKKNKKKTDRKCVRPSCTNHTDAALNNPPSNSIHLLMLQTALNAPS